jgi:hypothetical protein
MENFPPNSHKSREAPRTPRVERVVSQTARRRRRPLGKQFRDTFFAGTARGAWQYMVFNVALPELRRGFVEAINAGVESLVMGERIRGRRPPGAPTQSPYGTMTAPTRYDQVRQRDEAYQIPRTSRARHDFDDIVLNSRADAEEVLDQMYTALSQYEQVTVADLYELTGIRSSHVDEKWGWKGLSGAGFDRIRGGGGYVLRLPMPEFLG